MTTLVVFESMFGNTERVERAIAAGLTPYGDVEVVEVGQALTSLDGVDLLVLGGPTHALGMSRERTRADAVTQSTGGVVSQRCGLREWVGALSANRAVPFAAFDTKVYKARKLPGCARSASRAMRRRGHEPVALPHSFYVDGTLGPLLDGELERATRWGAVLGESARPAVGGGRR